MRTVNLLPGSYFQKLARRSAFRRNVVVAILLFVASIGCFALSQVDARQVHRLVDFERQRLDREQEQGRDLARLTAQHGDFRASEDLLADLEEPVPVVAILAALARAVPEEVVLNRLVVDVPTDARGGGGGGGGGGDSSASTGGRAGAAKAGPRPLRLELGGLAHTDREVVRCLSRIAEQPLFVNVKLGKSRHIQEGRTAKVAFQITLEVPLNREVIVAGKDDSHGN